MVTDHLGNKFKTQKEMYEHWGVPKNTFRKRKNKGLSLEECLTTPKRKYTIKDHHGKEHNSELAMCEYYNIDYYTYMKRKQKGLSLDQCLTSPKPKHIESKDPYDKTFASIVDMCRFYNVHERTFRDRLNRGHTIEEALGIIPLINPIRANQKITKDLTIIRTIENKTIPYFHCLINNNETIMTHNEIVTYLLSELKKEKQDAKQNTKKNQDHASCRP